MINVNPDNYRPLCKHWKHIVRLVIASEQNEYTQSARASQFHDLYLKLDYSLSRITSTIIRARGGLLDLYSSTFRYSSVGLCTLCKLDAFENTLHFIGVCPLYKDLRRKYFGESVVCSDDVINLLNGRRVNFYILYKYLEVSLRFREMVLNEFN